MVEVTFGAVVAVSTRVLKAGVVLTCHWKLTPGAVAGGCQESATGSVADVPDGGPTGVGAPGTGGGAEIVGVQPDRVTSTDTEPS